MPKTAQNFTGFVPTAICGTPLWKSITKTFWGGNFCSESSLHPKNIEEVLIVFSGIYVNNLPKEGISEFGEIC